ncbi:MAG: hypothetical protein KIT45_03365 [Fimbriimonadia bacterium]|nr:hypothetical protein [Fimbriimonadia bacterium]
MKIYEEFVDFLANSVPDQLIAFHPSPETQARAYELLTREKSGELKGDERVELDYYETLEQVFRLAKARAHRKMAGL